MGKTNIKKDLAEIDTILTAIIDNLKLGDFASGIAYANMNNALAKAISGVRIAFFESYEMYDF